MDLQVIWCVHLRTPVTDCVTWTSMTPQVEHRSHTCSCLHMIYQGCSTSQWFCILPNYLDHLFGSFSALNGCRVCGRQMPRCCPMRRRRMQCCAITSKQCGKRYVRCRRLLRNWPLATHSSLPIFKPLTSLTLPVVCLLTCFLMMIIIIIISKHNVHNVGKLNLRSWLLLNGCWLAVSWVDRFWDYVWMLNVKWNVWLREGGCV